MACSRAKSGWSECPLCEWAGVRLDEHFARAHMRRLPWQDNVRGKLVSWFECPACRWHGPVKGYWTGIGNRAYGVAEHWAQEGGLAKHLLEGLFVFDLL